MSTPQAKRRRLNEAASVLTKPFVSPFKTPVKPATSASSLQHKSPNPTPVDCESASSVNVAAIANPASSSRPMNKPLQQLGSLMQTSPSLRKTRPNSASSTPISTAALNTDPEIVALLKRQREVEWELREAKEALDVVEQARRIEELSVKKWGLGAEVDGELKVLVVKWRGATRAAAETLFGGVKDRVNRMGGPRAWREMQKKQREFQSGWDAEEAAKKLSDEDFESDEDDDEEQKVEKRKMREARDLYGDDQRLDVEVETEIEREQRGGDVVDEEDDNEDEFTMLMMLKTLNIDPKMIGYDKEMQKWVD